jgi:hypothetical protein
MAQVCSPGRFEAPQQQISPPLGQVDPAIADFRSGNRPHIATLRETRPHNLSFGILHDCMGNLANPRDFSWSEG